MVSWQGSHSRRICISDGVGPEQQLAVSTEGAPGERHLPHASPPGEAGETSSTTTRLQQRQQVKQTAAAAAAWPPGQHQQASAAGAAGAAAAAEPPA